MTYNPSIHQRRSIRLPFFESLAEPPRLDQLSRRQMLLPKIVGYFKMNSAKAVNEFLQTPGASLWQRNYYEHVIRDEADY